MTKYFASCLTACLAVLAAGSAQARPHDDALQSPWDHPVEAHGAGHDESCGEVPRLPARLTLNDYYSDASHSVIDPARKHAYDEQMQPLMKALHNVERMADDYRHTGDRATAECVARWLEGFASDKAFSQVSSNQDTYVQGWMLGAYAIAWLKVRPGLGSSSGASEHVQNWLGALADANMSYYDGRTRGSVTDSRNNHRYWAGLAVMATGIATNDPRRYRWGADSYRIGVSQITAEGTLPLEMSRKSLALHYHLFAAEPLVIMAELGEANGGHLYDEKGHALDRLVKRASDGVLNPAYFAKATGATQKEADYDPNLLAWVLTYDQRFPDGTLKSIVSRLPSTSAIYLGGQPPAANAP